MFSIRYRVADDFSDFNPDMPQYISPRDSIGGYIEITCGNFTTGFYWDGELMEDDCGYEDIDRWIDNLLNVLIQFLQGKSYAAFRLIETFDTWMMFKREQNNIEMWEVRGGTNFSESAFLIDPVQDLFCKTSAEGEASLAEFEQEILHKTNQFLQEMYATTKYAENLMFMTRIIEKVNKISYIKSNIS